MRATCGFIYKNASIPPIPLQNGPKCRSVRWVMPPSAQGVAGPACSARRRQPAHPKTAAPGWLRVAKTGEINISLALARRACRTCDSLWTEALNKPPNQPVGRPAAPPRICTPAPSCLANRASPATTSANLRRRHKRAMSLARVRRSGCASCRKTTPHNPGGKRLITRFGAGRRASSVNSQSGTAPGCCCFTRRAQATNP